MSAFMLRHEMPFQSGNHQQAHQCSGEAAIVQAHTAVEFRYSGHHAEVHHRCTHTIEPAVFVSNGAEAVGITQSHHNRLGIEMLGKVAVEDWGEKLEIRLFSTLADKYFPLDRERVRIQRSSM